MEYSFTILWLISILLMNDLYSSSFNQEEHAKQSHFNGDFEKTSIIFKTKEFSTQQKHLLSNPLVLPSIFHLSKGFPSLAVLT